MTFPTHKLLSGISNAYLWPFIHIGGAIKMVGEAKAPQNGHENILMLFAYYLA